MTNHVHVIAVPEAENSTGSASTRVPGDLREVSHSSTKSKPGLDELLPQEARYEEKASIASPESLSPARAVDPGHVGPRCPR